MFGVYFVFSLCCDLIAFVLVLFGTFVMLILLLVCVWLFLNIRVWVEFGVCLVICLLFVWICLFGVEIGF